jgi:hypothetical protein
MAGSKSLMAGLSCLKYFMALVKPFMGCMKSSDELSITFRTQILDVQFVKYVRFAKNRNYFCIKFLDPVLYEHFISADIEVQLIRVFEVKEGG